MEYTDINRWSMNKIKYWMCGSGGWSFGSFNSQCQKNSHKQSQTPS